MLVVHSGGRLDLGIPHSEPLFSLKICSSKQFHLWLLKCKLMVLDPRRSEKNSKHFTFFFFLQTVNYFPSKYLCLAPILNNISVKTNAFTWVDIVILVGTYITIHKLQIHKNFFLEALFLEYHVTLTDIFEFADRESSVRFSCGPWT